MAPPPAGPPPHPPLSGATLAVATVSLALATFMNVLDTTIANVSIPHIAGELSVSPNQGTWIITSYAVSTAIVVPLSGWLARRFGEVRLFVVCTLLFSLTSFLCGLAPTFNSLVNFRALQGAVAGPMIPISQSLLLRCYPPEKKGSALGFWSITTVVAPIIGPILGGYLTDNIGWEWIFFINVPVGCVAAYVAWQVLKERETPVVRQPIDRVGLGLLALWVGTLQLCLDLGHERDWFDDPLIVALALTSFTGFCLFLAWEWYEEHPVVDLSLFRIRNYSLATLTISMGYMAFFGTVVVLPLWLQTQMGYTATWAGLASAPIGILTIIFTPIVASNMHRFDLRYLATFAFFVFAGTSFWQAGFNTDATIWNVALPRLAMGIGMSCFFVPITTISLSQIPPERVASASGLTNFSRILAGSLGTSIVISMWEQRTSYHRSVLAENISSSGGAAARALEGLGGTGLSFEASAAAVARLAGQQAVMLATDDIFIASMWLFLGLITLIWCTTRVHPHR